MADAHVTCTNKVRSSHEGITHLGGVEWKWTRSQVIESIEARTNTFYTMVGGKRADVGVVNGPAGKYLRTYADGAPFRSAVNWWGRHCPHHLPGGR